MGEPRVTREPAATEGATGSYVVRSPSEWSMLTTGRPATMPAKTTTPSPADSTGPNGTLWRSTPRWPAAYGLGSRSKARVTVSGPSSGATHSAPAGTGADAAGRAAAEAGSRRRTSSRRAGTRARMARILGPDVTSWRAPR